MVQKLLHLIFFNHSITTMPKAQQESSKSLQGKESFGLLMI